jgi:anti-repressor protein
MKDLILINSQEINGAEVNTVNARDIYTYIESKQDFSTWIKNRLDNLGAIENEDYICFHKKMEANNATLKEYVVSLDIAKHLAMMERNEKGKIVRAYFIQKEKELNSTRLPFNPNDIISVLDYAKVIAVKNQILEAKIKEDRPLVSFAKAVENSVNSVLIREWVKSISEAENVTIGQNKAFSWLRENGYLMKNNEPYQRYINNGYFEIVGTIIATPKGTKEIFTTKITGKGQVALANKIMESFREIV